jgi:hypothetical protein
MSGSKRAKPCKVVLTGRNGYVATPVDAPSIAEGMRIAKSSGWFRYRIFVDGRVVRQGFCD